MKNSYVLMPTAWQIFSIVSTDNWPLRFDAAPNVE
jgi:hypothetical protein